MIDVPGPGVYRDMSFRDYLTLPYPSASSLKIGLNVSMKHMKAAVEGKLSDKDTTAKRFGRAFHCWLLEPDRFREEYAIQKHCMAVIGSGSRKGQQCTNWGTRQNPEDGRWYCGAHGKGLDEVGNMVTASELQDIEGAGKSLEKRSVFSLLRNLGWSEYTVIAEVEGVLVKSRYDYYALSLDGRKTIVDVKKITAMKGSEDELRKTIRKYGYDLQAALYREIHRAHFGDDAEFLWLFIEDSQPHEVVPRYLGEAMNLVGSAKALSTLRRWKECVEWDMYPGYCDEPAPIDPDEWECKSYGVNNFLD